jgi:hypothetical protein
MESGRKGLMMSGWLLGLTNDAIVTALSAVYDSTVYADLEKGSPHLLALCYDSSLLKQAEHLARCDFDRTLAILSWEGD